MPKPENKIAGTEEYPLALTSMGTNLFAAEQAKNGDIKGMFFYNSNMAAGYSNTAYLADALSQLDLIVVVDVQMSETALLADYVLPDTSYLERLELPEFIGGKVPAVALRDQVLEKVHPNTRPVDQIFSELAEACGVGEYFPFTVEELAAAQLETVGVSLDELKEKGIVGIGRRNVPHLRKAEARQAHRRRADQRLRVRALPDRRPSGHAGIRRRYRVRSPGYDEGRQRAGRRHPH